MNRQKLAIRESVTLLEAVCLVGQNRLTHSKDRRRRVLVVAYVTQGQSLAIECPTVRTYLVTPFSETTTMNWQVGFRRRTLET